MKKNAVCILIISAMALTLYIAKDPLQGSTLFSARTRTYDVEMKQDLLCLMMAYPEYVKDIEKTNNGNVYLVMKSGKKILYDDKRAKKIDEKIANPDLQDMLEQIYPLTTDRKLMDKSFDPGRARVYALLKDAYGASQQQVESNLTNAKAGYRSFQFNRNNQAAKALQSAMQELAALAEKRPAVRACAFPCSGTYNYRYIAGTNRLSPHAFGIAIDLARDKRDYWKWVSREEGQKRLATYPIEIVEIFERNNFIWGGKWGHFDILHFEYRPEIILKARYFGNRNRTEGLWYDGIPADDSIIKGCIEKIEQAL